MAIVTTDDKYYEDIAQSFRDIALQDSEHYEHFGGLDRKYKPSEIAEAIQETCNLAVDFKKEEYIEQGKKAQYDAFWDVFQSNGEAKNYYYAFAYDKFTDANYNPKHDIVCLANTTTACMAMFYNAFGITDIKVPIYANGNSLQAAFYQCTSLVRIPKLVVHENLTYQNTFYRCSSLEEINIWGTIGNSIDFSACKKLSGGSFESIITALSDTASGCTVTFSQEAYDSDTTGYWDLIWEYVASTKTNWTITLV